MGDMADMCREQEEMKSEGYKCYLCGIIIDDETTGSPRLCEDCMDGIEYDSDEHDWMPQFPKD